MKTTMNDMTKTLRGAAASLAVLASACAFAQESEAPAAAEPQVDAELQAEIEYVEALVDGGFADFATSVIEATKRRWPESEAMLFAIEVDGMLALGKFDEATAKIAALPDRNGLKYWAASLKMANYYHGRGNRKKCEEIYKEFFKKFPKPQKNIMKLYREASYAWGQLLASVGRHAEAVVEYERLLSVVARTRATSEDDDWFWCNVACETGEMYIRLAGEAAKPADRKKYLDGAKKIVDQLLWERQKYAIFGRAVAMLANVELLKGDIARAQATIDDYYPTLQEIHNALVEADRKEGRNAHYVRQSPLPLCRYMMAQLCWKEAQAEYKKPKRDDERVKALLFGDRGKRGKRNGKGAYNHALNVFLTYSWSSWAAPAGEMSREIREFAEKSYGAKIKDNVTPEKIAEVRAMQFRGGHEKFAEGDYKGAMADYDAALAACPESPESARAVENTVMAMLNMLARGAGSGDEKAAWRIDADAMEGYLAERFAGLADRAAMIAGGDAVQRLAAVERERGEKARGEALYREFILNYSRHPNAPVIASSLGATAQNDGEFDRAAWYWNAIRSSYTNTVQYAVALLNLSVCHDKAGDRRAAIADLLEYCAAETSPLKKTQAQMLLANHYKNEGQEMLKTAETNATPEAAAAQLSAGSAQIVRAMKQFNSFAETCERMLADASVSPGEKERYSDLREGAMFLVGDCWRRLTKPEERLEAFRKKAAEALEAYVKAYPKGKYAKQAYVQLGTIFTALGDMEGTRNALARLSADFPESDEAKNAMPRLARSLIEMGLAKEGAEIYADMLKKDGKYTAAHFLAAGDALIEAREWDLADRAFEKAASAAGTNQMTTVARARIGQAKSLFRQKSYAEARAQLDLFLSDAKMSRLAIAADANLLLAEIASEQGRTERNDEVRRRHFNAAVGAVKKLRTYWRGRPQEERDEIELMSADIVVNRMRAEDAMAAEASGNERERLEKAALDTCATAAQMFQTFLQTRAPDEEHPASSMSKEALANLERCYSSMIPLFSRLGDDQADRVMLYGGQYLELFPDGKARTDVQNCMNKAKVAAAAKAPAPAAPAPEAAGENPNEGGN